MWPFSVFNVFVFLVGALTLLYWYVQHQFSFWARKGVPFKKPHWLFGNFGELIKGNSALVDVLVDWYKEFEGQRFVGLWQLHTPILVAMDPELIRDVLIKDFDTWSSRGSVVNRDADPLSANLVNFDGSLWKSVRAKLTPTFTSGKLKQMHHLFLDCADELEQYMNQLASKGDPVEARELSAKFTTDVIGCCVFGLKMNAIRDENSTFRVMGRKIFVSSPKRRITEAIQRSLPKLFKLLNLSTLPPELTDFFLGLTKETMEHRVTNNIQRNDFIDLLRNLKNTGKPLAEGEIEFDDKLLAAHSFVFFAAGFETSSTVISFCAHELAVNQDVQDRLREEIRRQKAADNGQITWDALKNLKYLDMVFRETLRKYPPAPAVARTSSRPYRIANTDVVLPAGISCFVPIYPLHHDPKYYPDPEKFDPLRFTEENDHKRPQMSYLPFGAGPRFCIGSRFAEQQSKLGILKLVENFKISLCDKSTHPLEFSPTTPLTAPKNGIWIKISKI